MSWYDPSYACYPDEIDEELGPDEETPKTLPSPEPPARIYAGPFAPRVPTMPALTAPKPKPMLVASNR